jgi:hypothetical protein
MSHLSLEQPTQPDGSDAHSKPNVIQIKKLSSLVDWFSQVAAPSACCWFHLTKDAGAQGLLLQHLPITLLLCLPPSELFPSSARVSSAAFPVAMTFQGRSVLCLLAASPHDHCAQSQCQQHDQLTHQASAPDEIALLL